MFQRPICCLIGVAILSACLSQSGALQAQEPKAKPDPKKGSGSVDVEDYSYFFGKPQKLQEFWAAVKYEISVGKPSIAAGFLEQMLDFASKIEEKKRREEWVQLEKQEGMAAFLRLLGIEHWYDDEKRNDKAKNDARELIKQVGIAVRAYLEDPVRIAKYVKNLGASPEERDYALGELYQSGSAVIPELVSQMQSAGKAGNQEARLAMRDALVKLRPDTIPPLLAALDSNDPLLTIDVIEVLLRRGEKRAVPRLWYLLGKPNQDVGIRAAARSALAVLTETKPDLLPQPRDMLTRQADLYYQHRIEFSDPKAVPVWRWDAEKNRIVQGWDKTPTLPASKAEEYWGHRYATQALEIDPSYLPAQIVDLSLIVDKAMERTGLDVPLSKAPAAADADKVLMSVNPDLIIRVLERALQDKRVPVVLATVRALGALDEVRAARAGNSSESPLVKALNFGDRRVEMAAAEALLGIPGKPTPGTSTRVLDVLRRALSTSPEQPGAVGKVLVVYASPELGKQVARNVRRLGLEPVVVGTGRDALRRLNQAADVDLVLIDAAVFDPGLTGLLAQVRADAHAGRLPVLVAVAPEQDANLKSLNRQFQDENARFDQLRDALKKQEDLNVKASIERTRADLERQQKRLRDLTVQYVDESQRAEDRLRRLLDRYPSTWVVASDVPLDADQLRAAFKDRLDQPESQPLPDAVRKEYAERALLWLGRIARGEIAGYDIRSSDELPKAVYASLGDVSLSDAAVQSAIVIVGRLSSAESQRQLLGFLHHSKRPVELRRRAGEELTRSLQENGILLGKNDVGLLFDSFKDPNLDKALKPVVAGLVGLMQPDSRATGDRLKDFKPKIVPEAPPAPPPPAGSGEG
jgi:CheY-like chemotaxis protein